MDLTRDVILATGEGEGAWNISRWRRPRMADLCEKCRVGGACSLWVSTSTPARRSDRSKTTGDAAATATYRRDNMAKAPLRQRSDALAHRIE
jgi:hypothetical protein